MTNRKNYNSILFLTVYLGLALVGGSSHVFAHAASNALFELRNEIEFKEDLENKPDDSCAELKAKADENVSQFLEQYINLVSDSVKKYPSVTGFGLFEGYAGIYFPSLRGKILINYFEFLAKQDNLTGEGIIKSNFSTYLVKTSDFDFKVLTQSFNFQRCKTQKSPKKIIYDNTTISFQNNQVFIVTRLPRGSIDSLLK